MAESPNRGRPGPSTTGRGPKGPTTFRERLRHDRFLFAMCLGFLGFTTWALAITWRLMNDPLLFGLTVASILPAFYLFYLRDGVPS